MQKRYGMRVYADVAFEHANDHWSLLMSRNIRRMNSQVKTELLNQGGDLTRKTQNARNSIMDSMASAYTSLLLPIGQGSLST